jgi:hypothetical protein
MFWLLVLSIVFLGVGVIVFVLTRDSFRASRVRRETPPVAPSMQKKGDAAAINTLMQEELSAEPPPHPAVLLTGPYDKEADALADTLANVKENPILPTEPPAYLRLEEHDDSLDRLLIQRVRRRGGMIPPLPPPKPREFSIEVTERKEPLLECEKEMSRSENGRGDTQGNGAACGSR